MKKNDKKEKKEIIFPGPIMKGKMQTKKQNDKKRKKAHWPPLLPFDKHTIAFLDCFSLV